MKWSLLTDDPITTESRRAVVDENGREGFVKVRWPGNGRGPELFGSVFDEHFGPDDLDDEGWPVSEPTIEILDREPVFK